MEVPPIGWLLILIGLWFMVLRPKWLYALTIFFLPFTATAAINVGSGENTSGVQASLFLGSLMMLRVCASALWKMSFPLPRKGRMCLFWLGAFIAVAALSLIMPMWLDGHVRIPSPRLFDTSSTLIHLTNKNITGFLYIVFGFAFAYLIVAVNQSMATLRLTLKAFLAGAAFASLWGFLQLVCRMTGIAYPGMVFNTSRSGPALASALVFAGPYQQMTGIIRISSVCDEPSVFAQILLVALSLCLPFIFRTDTLFSRKIDRRLFWLLLVALCITTSSTAYLGLLIIVLVVFSLLFILGMLKLRDFRIPLAGLGAAALIYMTVPPARQVLDMALFTKAEGYSALERAMTVHNAFEMFQKHPVLGIGWSSIASHDLLVNILANAGILGLLFFLLAMYSIFRGLYRSIRSRSRSLGIEGLLHLDFAAYVALAVLLGTCAIDGFSYVFTYFWFALGLAMAAAKTKKWSGEIPSLNHSPEVVTQNKLQEFDSLSTGWNEK